MLTIPSPGENLPPLPAPTHASSAVTIQTVLEELEDRHQTSSLSHHNPRSLKKLSKPPYDPNALAKTICCGGDGNYHPSGLRNFTIREYACLQTFPWQFIFGQAQTATEMREQIGNAVPPRLAKAVFESISKSLLQSDKKTGTRGGNISREVIEIE